MTLARRRLIPAPAASPLRDETESVSMLFEQEYESMLRLAFVLTRDQHCAEDVVQQAFLDVQQKWASLLNPGGYLRTAVVNGCRRWHRREENRRRIVSENLVVLGQQAERSVDTYLRDVLDRLPERQRIAVVLAYYSGLGPREIAETLGCRLGTAKSLVHRGIDRMRRELGE